MARWRASGRGIATVGVATGAAFLVGQLLAGDHPFAALMKACLAALAVMAVGGTLQSLWRGDPLEEAEAGGVRLKFGSTRRAVHELEGRVAARFDGLNERVYNIERAISGDERDPGANDEAES
jgi:hypothetical protein